MSVFPAAFETTTTYPDTDAVRVVALSALSANDESTLKVVAQRPAHDANVLLQDIVVLKNVKMGIIKCLKLRIFKIRLFPSYFKNTAIYSVF